jgi:uncharacterized protein (TIGR02611 family)
MRSSSEPERAGERDEAGDRDDGREREDAGLGDDGGERKRGVEELAPSLEAGSYVLRQARRVIAGVVGATVALLGVAMLVLPGPGVLVLFLGLSILAAEFAWARSLLKRLKREGMRVIPERWRRIFFRRA